MCQAQVYSKKWGRLTSPPTINMRDENHLWGCSPGVVPGFFSFCNRDNSEVLQFQPFTLIILLSLATNCWLPCKSMHVCGGLLAGDLDCALSTWKVWERDYFFKDKTYEHWSCRKGKHRSVIPGIIACVTYIRSLFSGGHGTRLTMNVLCIYIDD